MSKLAKALMQGAAGAGGATYVDDVFSTYLYSGTDASQTITNGIDLSGKGGMVWIKGRNLPDQHSLYNTVNGAGYYLMSARTDSISYNTNQLSSFNSNGYSAGYISSDENYVSWTFRKQAKFFDVVTYTGTGSARTVSHNLGSTPGCIIVKRTDASGSWFVYHRGLLSPNDYYLLLNSTGVQANSTTVWNNTAPTSTVFSLGASPATNANGGTYVAYLFAHDAGGFGTAGTDNVISCGSWDSDGSFKNIELGYEPQFILFKKANESSDNWFIADDMRTWGAPPTDSNLANTLSPDSSAAEVAGNIQIYKTATGFITPDYGSGRKYIYIAIRRPMKPPTTGTEVFTPVLGANATGGTLAFTSGFPTDTIFYSKKGGGANTVGLTYSRLIGNKWMRTYATTAEATDNNGFFFDNQNGVYNNITVNWTDYISWNFRRAPEFFDVVCYSGTGSIRTIDHNLGVTPELMIFKARNNTTDWFCWHKSFSSSEYIVLNSSSAKQTSSTMFNSTLPTATNITFGDYNGINGPGENDIGYLWATLANVSKVGSYTGTGSTQQINCGFSGGARFVLIKRTDSTGDWYVWDTTRGIVSGNDPYLLMNSTAAQVTNTDYIDPYSAGFEISSTAPAAINANGGSYIYLAIA